MAGDVSAGVLAGTIELDDKFTTKVDLILEGINKIEGHLGGMAEHTHAGFLEMTASFFTAEAALHLVEKAAELAKEAIHQIVVEGSAVGDVSSAYEHLTAGANLAYDALAHLREGTHGQITDLELMKIENRDLGAGMVLSAHQMDVMTQAAYAFAQANMTDVKTGLDTVNDAMLTGRVRSIQLLTGKLDLIKAEDEFGKKNGLLANQLSETAKIESARIAIIDKLASVSDRLGASTDDLHNRYERVKVAFENFILKVESTVANSPVIQAAFDTISKAITDMVGDNQQKLVDATAKKIDDLMIAVVGYAEAGVDAAKVVINAFYETQNAFTHAIEGIQAITYVAENSILGIMKVLNNLPGSLGQFSTSIVGLQKDTDRLYDSMAKGEAAVEANRRASDGLTKSLDPLRALVTNLHDKMAAAAKTHHDTAAAADENAKAHDKAAGSIANAANAADLARHSLEMERAEIAAGADAWKKYDELILKNSGSSIALQKQQAKDWMDDQLQKLDITTKGWVTHYNAIIAMGKTMIDSAGVDLTKLHAGSRQAMQDAFDGASATYEYAVQHANQYSQEYLQILRRDREKAFDELRLYGHASVNQLEKIADKADDVSQHIRDITYTSTMLLQELTQAEFESLGGQHRLEQIEALYKMFPGRQIGGSGLTGVTNSIDYLAMIQEQKDYLQLKAASKLFGELHGNTLADPAGSAGASPAGFTTTASDQLASSGPATPDAASPTGLKFWALANMFGRAPTPFERGHNQYSNVFNFNISGAKDSRAVADEVLQILGNNATLSRQFSQGAR